MHYQYIAVSFLQIYDVVVSILFDDNFSIHIPTVFNALREVISISWKIMLLS
jgi:hypothetical protein